MMLTALGLMSGTSLDGVDVAVIETDGRKVTAFGPSGYRPYTNVERRLLLQALTEAVHLQAREARPGILQEAERVVTNAHAEAIASFKSQHRITSEDIDIVGFHGQTVLHRPADKMTVQIGDAAALAKAVHIPVMHDFRAADVAAGGQGAPFMPAFHRAMVRLLAEPHPVGIINIGGVANLTSIDGDELVACDTGPGNALIDDFLRLRSGSSHDADGRAAAAGRVDEAAVARILAHPFFAQPPPKSLDRNAFQHWIAQDAKLAGKSLEDGAATLTALTAAAIARASELLPRAPASYIAAGGGIRNPVLMRMLVERLAPATLKTADAVGWSGDALEAQGFAYLAVRSLYGLPLSYPGTTGVPTPMTGGVLARP